MYTYIVSLERLYPSKDVLLLEKMGNGGSMDGINRMIMVYGTTFIKCPVKKGVTESLTGLFFGIPCVLIHLVTNFQLCISTS